MEEERKGKKTIKCSYALLVIILFAALAFVTDYAIIERKTRKCDCPKCETTNNEVKSDNTDNNNYQETVKKDIYKDYVFDIVYDNDVSIESYTTTFQKTYYLNDIVVPYININSDDALKVNVEIKDVFNSAIDIYKKGINDKMSYVSDCSYKYYINDNILSVVLTYGHGATSIVHPEYYTYNFDLTNGNLVSYDDVYSYVGFKNDNINEIVKESITSVMTNRMSNVSDDLKKEFDFYNNNSYDNYIESVSNKTIKYFIDSNKNLNIIVRLNIPADTGKFDTIITVK